MAVRVGGASPQLDDGNVRGSFNPSASHVAQPHLYNVSWSLPSRLPHAQAKALLTGLFDAHGDAHHRQGASRGPRLQIPAKSQRHRTMPKQPPLAAEMAELMAALDADLAARLGGGGGGDGSSSTDGASSSGGGGSSISSPLPTLPMAMGVEVPTEVDVRLLLSSNARRLLEYRFVSWSMLSGGQTRGWQ